MKALKPWGLKALKGSSSFLRQQQSLSGPGSNPRFMYGAGVGAGAGIWGEGPGEGVLQVCWSPGSALGTPAQGLPGPSGEKGETGDVGPMVSAAPLTG